MELDCSNDKTTATGDQRLGAISMTIIQYILSLSTLLFLSCSSRPSDTPQRDLKEASRTVSENDNWTAITFFITDTSIVKNPFVKLTTVDKEGTYKVEWGNENASWSDNLMTLTDSQGYSMPPTVLWHNDKWICLMTNHSGPYSQHLFLPLEPEINSEKI